MLFATHELPDQPCRSCGQLCDAQFTLCAPCSDRARNSEAFDIAWSRMNEATFRKTVAVLLVAAVMAPTVRVITVRGEEVRGAA